MLRFLHTADWQLGARFSQFGSQGTQLRAARLKTLQRALEYAQTEALDAFLIAGDLFEDNHVDDSLVTSVVDLFANFSRVPIFILPGNHDPFTGPDCIWQRRSWRKVAPHVRVFTEPGAQPLSADAFLIASPLRQKRSTVDPSLALVPLAAALPASAIKVGMTHGALAIEGRHQPNDFPISLQAASRAGLDYLGVGHWHNWLVDTDGGRIVMPGTPEPDRFGHEQAGQGALVEIAQPGQKPNVTAVPFATLSWQTLTFDLHNEAAARAALDAFLAAHRTHPHQAVLRITLTGSASAQHMAALQEELSTHLAPFLVGQVVDETRLELSRAELEALHQRHPLLSQIFADIDQLERFATGQNADSLSMVRPTDPALSLAEAQTLLGSSRIELSQLTRTDFIFLRQTLLRQLQEVSA